MRRWGLTTVVLIVCVVLTATTAQAGFKFWNIGNSRGVGEQGYNDGTLSFGVIDMGMSGSISETLLKNAFVPGDDYNGSKAGVGAGGDELDTDARFLYVYQYVNDGDGAEAVDQLSVALGLSDDDPFANVTSWGYFDDLSFQDDAGEIGDGSSPKRNAFGYDGLDFTHPASYTVGGPYSRQVVQTARTDGDGDGDILETPNETNKTGVELYDTGAFQMFHVIFDDDTIQADETTVVFGFTSDSHPYLAKDITAEDNDDLKTLVGPSFRGFTHFSMNPEPSAVVGLWTMALTGALIFFRRREQRAAAVV